MVQWLDFSPVTQKPGARFPTGGKSGATVYRTNVVLPQWTWHKLHHSDKVGYCREWRGGPIATLTQVVAYDHTDGHV